MIPLLPRFVSRQQRVPRPGSPGRGSSVWSICYTYPVSLADEYRDKINRQADRLGIDTKDLARRAGVDRSGLSHFLNGRGNPTLDWIDNVLGALKRAKRPRKKRSG